MSELPAKSEECASVPQPPIRFTVIQSPLNRVKLELAGVLAIAVPLYVLVEILLTTGWTQVLVLAGYGAVSGIWLALRARRVVAESADALSRG
ncbi:MAG: hypothetical protein DWQ09_17100 [Proteobacteria bacterium]|nr:MAG: hypothetical protein DWQ09_17100 [Pseudomonadota bacterium]QKK12193.1 MAG: hypothetical protein HND59_12030 [Pseudomonadota bacterium]